MGSLEDYPCLLSSIHQRIHLSLIGCRQRISPWASDYRQCEVVESQAIWRAELELPGLQHFGFLSGDAVLHTEGRGVQLEPDPVEVVNRVSLSVDDGAGDLW